MIYEVRSYRLKPRAVPGFIEAFGEAYEYRKDFSPLSASSQCLGSSLAT